MRSTRKILAAQAMTATARDERAAEMADLYAGGISKSAIGRMYTPRLSRQRVHQILKVWARRGEAAGG